MQRIMVAMLFFGSSSALIAANLQERAFCFKKVFDRLAHVNRDLEKIAAYIKCLRDNPESEGFVLEKGVLRLAYAINDPTRNRPFVECSRSFSVSSVYKCELDGVKFADQQIASETFNQLKTLNFVQNVAVARIEQEQRIKQN